MLLSSGWPWTYDPPTITSQVLESQVHTAAPGWTNLCCLGCLPVLGDFLKCVREAHPWYELGTIHTFHNDKSRTVALKLCEHRHRHRHRQNSKPLLLCTTHRVSRIILRQGCSFQNCQSAFPTSPQDPGWHPKHCLHSSVLHRQGQGATSAMASQVTVSLLMIEASLC